jgi:uroporphyrinogen decarboxylase
VNNKDTIEKVARLETVDRYPFALLSSGTWAITRKGLSLENALKEPVQTVVDALYEGYTLAGSAISWVGSGYNNLVVRALGGEIKFRRKGTPDVVDAMLQDIHDIDKIDTSLIHKDPDIQFIYNTVKGLVEKEADQRLVGASMWGPFTLAGLLVGADKLMRSVLRDKEGARALLSRASEIYLEYMRGYIENGAKVIFMAEPSASGDMIARRHFEEMVFPSIKEVFKTLREKDPSLILGLHICGDSSQMLDLIADSGAHIFSLDYKVDIAEASEAFDSKIAFSGNLNPVDIVANGTEEEIVSGTIECIKGVNRGSAYIVMPGCDIPPATPLENIQTLSRTVQSYQYQ